MMNFLKGSLIFLGGFASGVAASYVVATRVFHIEWVYDEPEEDIEGTTEEDTTEPKTNIEELQYTSIEDNSEYVDYSKLIVPGTESYENDISDDEDIPTEVEVFEETNRNLKPHMIDEETYGLEFDYDEIELRYYDREDILTDDWGYPVENVDQTIGYDAMDELRKGTSDVVYVINDRLKAYYEIIKQTDNYPGISG